MHLPGWRNLRRPPRTTVKGTVGTSRHAKLGASTLRDFSVAATIDGEPIGGDAWQAIPCGTDDLVLRKGTWVDADRGKLERRTYWREAER